jgi:hypothetical protein
VAIHSFPCGGDRKLFWIAETRSRQHLSLLKKRPRRLSVWGAQLPCPVTHYRSVAGKDLEQIVFAVLLGEEQPRLAFLEYLRSDQTAD